MGAGLPEPKIFLRASPARPSGLTLYSAQNSGPLRGKAATRQDLGPFLEIPLPGVSGKMRSFLPPGGADLGCHALEAFHCLMPDNTTVPCDTYNMYNETGRPARPKRP